MKKQKKQLGETLRAFREAKGFTAYKVAKDGHIRQENVRIVEKGEANYTIETFLGYLAGCQLDITVTDRE